MIRVGVIGLGSMGYTHLDAYARHPLAEVVAVSDQNPRRLAGEITPTGNIEGQAGTAFDLASARAVADPFNLIDDPEVELVDVCAVTPLHRTLAERALRAGKHVFVEKPLARTADDAEALADLADARPDRVAMVGMCMRFWPGWTWLKQAIDDATLGRLRSLHLDRLAPHPDTRFTRDGAASGGALLDLHLHDTDFVLHLLDTPRAVTSRGHAAVTSAIDHVATQYHFGPPDGNAPVVTATGGWAMAPGFPFTMRYVADFDHATAVYDLAATPPLTLYRQGEAEPIALEPGLGYDHEIDHLLSCIDAGTPTREATFRQSFEAIRVVEAEAESCRTGRPIALDARSHA
jgi:predicted dehydrogenase